MTEQEQALENYKDVICGLLDYIRHGFGEEEANAAHLFACDALEDQELRDKLKENING